MVMIHSHGKLRSAHGTRPSQKLEWKQTRTDFITFLANAVGKETSDRPRLRASELVLD